jgi:hypothetical protein
MPTVATPNILTDPGYLFWSPLGTAAPTNTVAGSKFTDTWAAAWIPLGATENGTQLAYSSTVEAVTVAEFFDPIKYATTARSGNVAFNLADYTLANWKRAMNGGAMALVSGTGATTLTSYSPPAPGAEVRCQIGWESLDGTLRLLAYQTLQGGEITSAFRKAPALALIPCQFNMEIPSSGKPFELFAAGTARGGTVF